MPAPLENQNAVKPEGEGATSNIHAKMTREDKGLFKLAAEDWARERNITDRRGPLTMWVLAALHAFVPAHINELVKRKKEEQERKERERISRQQ